MNVVDASGWLEYFSDGPDAAFVAQVLQETETLIVPTVTILEVFGSVCRSHGEGAALQAAAAMQQGRVVSLDTAAALDAGRLSVTYGVPTSAGAVLAVAERHGATVWSLDAAVRQVPGVRFREPTMRAAAERPKAW